MFDDKKQPLILVYALVFFGLLAIVSYLLLTNYSAPVTDNTTAESVNVPSYQNLYSSRE